MERLVLSILVDNTPGVLNRVAGLFSRRSYNIDSLTVGETNDPHISRMTVVSTGDAETLEQIEKQVRKLEDVKEVFKLEDTNSVYRELVLIKVECSHKERVDIVSIVDIYRGKIVDVSPDSMVIEITGTQSKIDGLLAMMTDFNVTEIVRTGIAGIGRGLRDEDKERIKAR
ncbi:MAG TPA: acetolactate synthase small subunit [Erysipelotrichaceae bacterium]|nr:acetolactate synthase small subunit [Erysipelotrichaceae bacterium]